MACAPMDFFYNFQMSHLNRRLGVNSECLHIRVQNSILYLFIYLQTNVHSEGERKAKVEETVQSVLGGYVCVCLEKSSNFGSFLKSIILHVKVIVQINRLWFLWGMVCIDLENGESHFIQARAFTHFNLDFVPRNCFCCCLLALF